MSGFRQGLFGAVAWLALGGAQARAVPADMAARGEIVVGVKTDFAPFGMLDAAGQPVGMEVDLAHRLAGSLGLRARVVAVSTENRFQRLEQGAVDVLLATAGDTRERRALATAVEPHYYAGGVTVMLPSTARVPDWAALRGQTLCAVQGAYFNRAITQRHILTLQTYRSVRDALLALESSRCTGLLYTDVAVGHWLKEPRWSNYRSLSPSALVVPWAIYLPRSARGSALEAHIGDLVAQWHRDGTLMGLEKTWGLPASDFLRDTRALWSRVDADGAFVCRRDGGTEWPLACRHPTFITAADVQGIRGLGLWMRDSLGLDVSLLHDPFDAQRYLKGVLLSMWLCAASIAGALVLGFCGARLALSPQPFLSGLARTAASVGRATPLLLQMYFLYFGLGAWLVLHTGWGLSPLWVAVLCLSAYHGAMIVFTFTESVRVLRLSGPGFVFSLRTLPLVLASASVGVKVALTNLTKASVIASAIAVPELLAATTAIIADRGNTVLMMNVMLVSFFLLSALWTRVIEHAEQCVQRRWARGA